MSDTVVSTDLALWTCFGLTCALLLARFAAFDSLGWHFDASKALVLLALAVVIARTVCVHYVLILEPTIHRQAVSEYSTLRTERGLVLAARLLITTFFWLQCSLLLLLYRRVLRDIAWVQIAGRVCWTLIAVTYGVVVLATFLECHPSQFGQQDRSQACDKAYGQLLAQGICNIVIDILLLVIALPLLQAQARRFPRNLQLAFLYMIGFLCIIVSCLRIIYIYDANSAQVTRDLWASVQQVVSCFVANAPALYGTLVLWGRKWRPSSSEQPPHGASYAELDSPLASYPPKLKMDAFTSTLSGHIEDVSDQRSSVK